MSMLVMNFQLPCEEYALEHIGDVIEHSLLKFTDTSDRKLNFVIQELIVNAYEATVKKYEDAALNYHIDIKVEINNDFISASITDRGTGISEQQYRSFTKKTLEDALHQERGRGLLMVKELVDQLSFYQEDHDLFTVSIEKRR
ncbi:ATP-binding protein [Bacillus suaedae]|uniref:ATP-binding protein n=1 Tax=Halalkalibacter suaedae TaxID=2822140 RepID=A0A940WU89_9BACI|nr:ATP-binding protein [Bacillus suaedae]MBP3950747.1 ATP-binding protein [Bacillus suaedae]